MDRTEIIYNLAEIAGWEAYRNEPMSRHTSFKIGGEADTYIKVKDISQLKTLIKECREADVGYFLIGNGSNILVSDEGIKGVVIKLGGEFKNISLLDDETIYCGSGASLASLCKFALNSGLSGLEFAWGIPGSVGGALFMNAGAYGGEMKQVVHSVSHITPKGEVGRIDRDDLEFGYRTSVYRTNKAIITGDSSQIDLGPRQVSGFAHAIRLLSKIRGISHIAFPQTDVLRHPLVREIVKAYEHGGKK